MGTQGTPNQPNASDYEQFEYDNNGNLRWKRTRKGYWIEMQDDPLSRESAKIVRVGTKTAAAQSHIAKELAL